MLGNPSDLIPERFFVKGISVLLFTGYIIAALSSAADARGVRRGGTVVHRGGGGTVTHQSTTVRRGGTTRGGVVVGRRVHVLPSGHTTVVVRGGTYYLHRGVYYRPYYEGTTVVYVIVENPE